ncbi:MAG: hypothetical protein ABIU95_10335 [Burkholderiales bacterium]
MSASEVRAAIRAINTTTGRVTVLGSSRYGENESDFIATTLARQAATNAVSLKGRGAATRQRVASPAENSGSTMERFRTSFTAMTSTNQIDLYAIEVDAQTAGLLDYAKTCHRQSNGLVDITSGVLPRDDSRTIASIALTEVVLATNGDYATIAILL